MFRYALQTFCYAFLVSFCSILASSAVSAADPNESGKRPSISSVTKIPRVIHEAIQSRQYEDAVKAIEAELQNEALQSADYLLYLKGVALSESDQRDDAVAAYLDLEKRYPNSEWVSRSRFGRASVAVMNRQYGQAGEIYRREAERLLSRGRKDKLSQIYLEFADRFFQGVESKDPSKNKQPDFKQALEYYREAKKLGPSAAEQQQIEFRVARCLEELDDKDASTKAYQEFIKQHGGEKPASGEAASLSLRFEANYRLGLCQLKNNRPSAARRTWQDFLNKHDLPPAESKELADLLANAKYRMSHTYGLPNPATIGDLELGVALAEQFLKAYPNHSLAVKAELEIAQGYERHRRNLQAVARLETLIANPNYKDSKHLAIARRMLGQSYLAQNEFQKAIDAWKTFLDKHPTDSQWPDVQQKIIGAEFAAADHARVRNDYDTARQLWQTFLNKYPLDTRAPTILFQFGDMNYRDAHKRHQQRVQASVKKDQPPAEVTLNKVCRDLYENAIADWGRLVAKYPDTAEASSASLRVGITLEEQLQRRKEALESYKKVKGASEASAIQRIKRLTQPELQVMTQRKFRSDEEPAILLTTRNLENVSVAVYSIDMTDYFRKMHLATGVEKLNIALIDPDEQFQHSVQDYQDFERIEQEVKIPIDGPGVTAVTVSSDKMEATTMVVVSDLDIIVKSSRNELFLFAQNMRTGKPAEGVTVLVSDGDSVFEERSTDAEGIVKTNSKKLRDIKDLRVFAVTEGHIASTVTNLNGLDFAVGLVPTGHLFTDRPVYRPGELVNIKGIVRWVDQDRFTFQSGEQFTLDVYDSRGRKLKTQKVALNAFGTIHTNLLLPESAAPGLCRIHLHRHASFDAPALSFESQFEVKQFKLEPIQLSIDSDETVYFRGDEITATVKLQYYYGAVLPAQEITYSLSGSGETRTAKTNEDGEVELVFPTQRFSEAQAITLKVDCPERNVSQTHVVFLATRGFTISVNTARKVFIAGETFDASVKVVDPSGKAVATPLELQVFEITSHAGVNGERLVNTYAIDTDDEAGETTQTLRVEEAGIYIVRATAVDRFENSVSGQTRVQLSGDDDTTRLRILADKHQFEVGDESEVRLHWRESPALALITFDGASVLGHRLVNLKQGENKIRVKMNADLAPNFFLSATVMQRNKFHQAVSGFVVAKRLQVKLTASSTELKPTERVNVGIEVSDSGGRPIAAEVAMAMVQSNLLDRFGDSQRPIADSFRSSLRQRRMRQSSSCIFSYAPRTRSIDGALLVETERRSRRLAEANALEGLVAGAENWESSAESIWIDGTSAPPSQAYGYTGGADLRQSYESEPTEEVIAGLMTNRARGLQQQALQRQLGRVSVLSSMLGDQESRLQRGVRAQLRSHTIAGDTIQNDSVQLGQSQFGRAKGQDQRRSRWFFRPDNQVDIQLLQRRDVTINGLTLDGKLLVINGMNQADVSRLTNLQGARIFAAAASGETGFWDPVIVTGDDGKAEIEITMPADSTAWRLRADAISADTLAGSDSVELVTRKTLFGQLKTPQAFTVGDQADIEVEIHNALKGDRSIDVTLQATMGNQSLRQVETLVVSDSGIESLSFPVEIEESEDVSFELTVSTKDQPDDISLSTSKVLPYGFPVYQTASGTASQNTLALIELDSSQTARGQTLDLLIGGNINQSLMDSMVRGDTLLPFRCVATSMLARSASDCMGGVALLETVRRSAQQDSPQATKVTEMISAAVSNLVASQREDGGWSLSGKSDGDADSILSARIMASLARARDAGFAVSNQPFEKGIAALKKAFSGESDLNRQAVLLSAVSECGSGDFALANRLYRERNRLDSYGLVHLMLALTELNHRDMADELVTLIKLDSPRERFAVGRTTVEIAALQLIALQRTKTRPELRAKLARRLLSGRAGSRWPIESDNGPAIAALSAHFGQTPPNQEKVALTIFVNGNEIEKLILNPGGASHRVRVPDEFLEQDRQRIEFELDGRGEFSYSAVMKGFLDADALKNTTKDWSVTRRYEPDQLRFDGRLIPRGHRVINGSYSSTQNKLTQLPVGVRGKVTLSPRIRYLNSRPLRAYLMLVEPIPAGCTVLEETISGVFDRYEVTPGAITFYIGDARVPGEIRYTLAGYSPGSYRTAPAVLRSFFSPSEIAVSKPHSLQILRSGQKSTDQYKLTPDERFELGKLHFAKGNFQQAYDHLSDLHSNWQLDPKPYKESVSLLFRASMKLASHAETVKYFEIIKERFPDVELSFEEILQVASAYREIAEYERSYLVYRATVQGSFEKENQVAGFLNARGEFLRSVQTMEALLRDYPAESYVATASYALAQEVYRRAGAVGEDARLTEAGVTRVDLIDGSIRMLDDFMTNWPEDPSGDQASFALATALIDLQQYKLAIKRGGQYAQRYPTSRLLDSFWYMIGFCYFELQDHQKALEMCQKVAQASFEDPKTGSTRQADNKWEAIYIMGQIHHSLGQAAKAIDEYAKVSERFNDAAEAIAFFSRKSVSLPDVTTLLPEEKVEVLLAHRNLPEVFIKVYRIDLMKFGLTQRNLDRITAINLAGIKPYHQETIKLGDGKDYRNRETRVALPLKEQGAYLVVCRGENLYTSGLIVVSPLTLSVEEDQVSGRVRVSVKDKKKDAFVGDVHVKVIGSANSDFVSGQTDLRGLFVADAIKGTSTVIAVSQDDQYAFHRGDVPLMRSSVQSRNESDAAGQMGTPFGQAASQQPATAPVNAGNKPLLNNLFNQNGVFQTEQKLNIDGLFNNRRKGVQSKEAY